MINNDSFETTSFMRKISKEPELFIFTILLPCFIKLHTQNKKKYNYNCIISVAIQTIIITVQNKKTATIKCNEKVVIEQVAGDSCSTKIVDKKEGNSIKTSEGNFLGKLIRKSLKQNVLGKV